MKGDFTRLTFRPDKHYSSVLMQQGRLQLDSDWNEQADIQTHLYRTQVLDFIGAASGAPTSANDPTQKTAYKDSFKVSETSDREDLFIAPGRFYVNGTLCELEETPVDFEVKPANQIKVKTLIVDGRKFEIGQWIKILADQNIFKINREINTQTLELPLSGEVIIPGKLTGRLSRVLTYRTQPDYPNPETFENGLYFAYLDVWQRHITTIEDPGLREAALNIPDTTTRTKTVWQLKLQPLNRKFIKDNTKDNKILEKTRDDLLKELDVLSIERLTESFKVLLNIAEIPQDQQGIAITEFESLLSTDITPDITSDTSLWKPKFDEVLKSRQVSERLAERLVAKRTTLTSSLNGLLNTIKPEDTQSFNQLLDNVEHQEELKSLFKALLEKVTPSDAENAENEKNFDDLLTKITLNKERKDALQKSFDELLAKVILEKEEQTKLQNYFKELKEAASEETRAAWDEKFTKFASLITNGSAFQSNFEDFLDKAFASDTVLRELESYEKDETIAGDSPKWISFTKKAWSLFPQRNKRRKPYMTACARLCNASGSAASSDSRYRRLENQLYRVEIHNPGKVGDTSSGAGIKKATFKWSRDNGSIVSTVENAQKFEKGIITIRKSAQDAWASSKSGQWIEFLDEERELKGEPGQLARLSRVSDNKIEFDVASLVGEKVKKPTKVRRWDHMTKEESILTHIEWVELEAGIKVQFDQDSEYKTGDYWLIPARAATNDIEWPDDQAEDLNRRKPLPQAALGIEHDYALLASVKVLRGTFQPLIEGQDHRFIFPALAYTFDSREGVINGNLEVKETLTTKNLKVTGEFSNNTFQGATFAVTQDPTSDNPIPYGLIQVSAANETPKRVEFVTQEAKVFAFTSNDIKVGIGANNPKNRLDVFGAVAIGESASAPDNGLLVKGQVRIGTINDQNDNSTQLLVGGTVKATSFSGNGSALTGVVKTAGDNEFNGKLTVKGNTVLALPPNPAFPTNQNFTVGIGFENSTSKLTVNGNAAIGENYALVQAPTNGLLVQGDVGIGRDNGSQPNARLDIKGVSSNASQAALTITNSGDNNLVWVRNDGNVGIGIDNLSEIREKLHVDGGIQCKRLLIDADELPPDVPTQDDPQPKLYVNGSLLVEKRIFAKEVRAENQTAATFNQVSSRTLKDQVSDLSSQEVEGILKRLNPVKFVYTEDVTKSFRAGFIAEDTPDLLTSSDKQAIKILDVVAVLTRAVKDQQIISEELSEVADNQRNELEMLREKLRELEGQNFDGLQVIHTIPQANVAAASSLDEKRVPRASRHTEWFLYRKLKRFIRHLLAIV